MALKHKVFSSNPYLRYSFPSTVNSNHAEERERERGKSKIYCLISYLRLNSSSTLVR